MRELTSHCSGVLLRSYDLVINEQTFSLLPEMISIKRYQKTIHGNVVIVCMFIVGVVSFPVIDVVPSVIEPSFGIGRILYAILEHNYQMREDDEKRNWLSLPPAVAPVSCSVLPLSGNEQFDSFVNAIGTSDSALIN